MKESVLSSKCYPWSDEGPLCPVLDDPEVWMRAFSEYFGIVRIVKQGCKAFGYQRIIRSYDTASFGEATRILLNKAQGRQWLTSTFRKRGAPGLHRWLFQVFYDQKLSQILPVTSFCAKDSQGYHIPDIQVARKWLKKRHYSRDSIPSLTGLFCVFAIGQPEVAQDVLESLIETDQRFESYVLVSESEQAIEPVAADKTAAGQPEDEVSDLTTNEPSRSVQATLPSPASAFETMSNAAFFSEAGLNEGRLVLQSFLESESRTAETLKDDSETSSEESTQGDETEIAEAVHDDEAARQTELWISQLFHRLSKEGAENLEASPGRLASMFAQSAQPNDTPLLLKKACQDIVASLDELIPTIAKRNDESLKALEEIHRVDSLLNREHFKCVSHVPAGNLLDAIKSEREILDKLTLSRHDVASVLAERKRTALDTVDRLSDRLDFDSLGSEITNELKMLAEAVKSCDSLEELIPLQERCSRRSLELLHDPRGWKVPELVTEVQQELPSASSVVKLARALIARGRSAEALAVLTLLQLTVERKASGIDDYSDFVDVSILAATNVHPDCSIWLDAIWQQPWIRDLSRAQIRNYQTWQRLTAGFLARHHVQRSVDETELFYKLELQKVWTRERFGTLTLLLESISTQKPVFVVTERASSDRDAIEGRLKSIFRQNERGEYLRQAGRSRDPFHAMERLHLFPKMEEVLQKTRLQLVNSQWKSARELAQQNPERLFHKTCKEAGIAAGSSAFYKKQVLNAQSGYLTLFFRDLNALVDTAIKESGTLTEYILAKDVVGELQSIADQDPLFESFWAAVGQTFVQGANEITHTGSAHEIVVELCRISGEVALIATDFVVALCSEGPECKIGSAVFDGILARLAAATVSDDILRLQAEQCYQHALLGLSTARPRSGDALDINAVEAELKEQLSQTRARLTDRWTAIREEPVEARFNDQAFHSVLGAGYFSYLDRILREAEDRRRTVSEKQRAEEDMWVLAQAHRVSAAQEASLNVNRPNEWHQKLHEICSALQGILLSARRELKQGGALSVDRPLMTEAVDALSFVAENGSEMFDEITHHVGALQSYSSTPDIPELLTAGKRETTEIRVPEIARAWSELKRSVKGAPHDVSRNWGNLVHHFCIACRLYHDLGKTLIRNVVMNSRWVRYTTQFVNPRSSWLDREVNLYLCFGNRASQRELESLRGELETRSNSLNLVFVPLGYAKLVKDLQYDPIRSPFVPIPDAVLAQICAGDHGKDGQRHDIPLRQLLHRSAENLTVIGLFKSEGYVHQQKNLFVGRVRALQQLVQQPASVIWGGRRTGKTSLLHALQRRLEQQTKAGLYKVALVYGDTVVENPDLHFAKDICRQLELEMPSTLEDFSNIMHAACETMRIAVLIDEMDQYIIRSASVHGDDVFPLARELRGLSQSDSHQRFKLVYAGFKRLYYEVEIRHSEDPSYPFKNILQPITKDFRDFELHEVTELMRLGFDEMLGVTWDINVPRVITDKTSGHPAFVQRFCELLLERLSRRRLQEKSQLHVTRELVEEVYNESPIGSGGDAFINYVYETLDYNVSALERAILLAISTEILSTGAPERRSFSRHELIACLQQWTQEMPSPPSDEDIADALQMLTMTNMLTVQETGGQQRYQVTYPAYIYFMQRLDELGKVEIFRSLEAYHEKERGRLLSGFGT